MRNLPAYRLVIIGSGEEQENLRRRCQTAAVADRVDFVSRVPQDKLKTYYGAADADQAENVYPMIAAGKGHHEMHLSPGQQGVDVERELA